MKQAALKDDFTSKREPWEKAYKKHFIKRGGDVSMPIYEYECRVCKERFEVLQFSNEDEEIFRCPRCQADKPQRIVSLFSSGSIKRVSNTSCSSTGST